MAYDLSAVDLFFLTKELKALEGSKVDKIVQLDRKLFLFRFFSGKEKKNLRILVPELVNLTERKYESPLTPLGFCSFLRKYLQNTRLKGVSQKGFERILLLEFESLKMGELVLIIELFKPGNMILCRKEKGEEGKGNEEEKLIILNALERQAFKDRKVEARTEYLFPPERNNPMFMEENELISIVRESDKSIGKALATDLSLGGTYAEEIVVRAGVNRESKEISSKDAAKIRRAFADFFSEKTNCFSLKGKIYPVNMHSLKSETVFSSFNEGLDSVELEIAREEQKSSDAKHKKSKTASLLETQTKRIKELETEIIEAQEKGEFIYEHYQEFQKLLDAVKDMRSKGKSYDEIEAELRKNTHFRSLNKAKKTIKMGF
ncbi:MAG: NFACT family protein [Candidatus Nanoarchaeia archaeon]